MKKLQLSILFLLVMTMPLSFASHYFFVQFSDKNNSLYTLHEPEAYLSERAIERRLYYGIETDSLDLPVNSHYVEQLISPGLSIHSRSKWLNGVTVIAQDSTIMNTIRTLPFVKSVFYTGKKGSPYSAPLRTKWDSQQYDYGSALGQLNQLKGQILHEQGATGKGILIGVLDAGFRNVSTNPGFDSLRSNGRLLGHTSIIDPSIDVFQEDPHGANVLSVMAGMRPGLYTGTAPDASYWLIQTEYVPTEYMVEVDFWVRGIEFADSVGVDIINSSLGYTEFDDSSMNFTYNDMNGGVSRASIAAGIASKKGIIICTSAGNAGNSKWKYLGSPADAHGILAIGSVDALGYPSFFTSYGPAADGRVKPEVVAQGSQTAIISINATITTSNGTSFSSPVMAGIVACYLQYLRDTSIKLSVQEIIDAICATGNHFTKPHQQLGYGIPDFSKLPGLTTAMSQDSEEIPFLFDSMNKVLRISSKTNCPLTTVHIYDMAGRILIDKTLHSYTDEIDISDLPGGFYVLTINNRSTSRRSFKFIN
jgi:serine protease AprX